MRRPTFVRLAFAFATLTLVVSFAAPTAAAAPGVRYGIADDAWLEHGTGTLESRLAKLDDLGVQIVRFTLRWDAIAPTRPSAATDPADTAYDWSADDAILNGLRAHGIRVVLGLLGTPGWANGGQASNVAPTTGTSFGAFARAAARHYPWVKQWLIWNEPNQQRWLRPTSAAVYVTRLLNPAYAAIHAQLASVQVGGGVTAPRAAAGGVSPVAWILGMHAAHARLDAYAHNPYPLNPKRESPRTGGCTHCTTLTMATIGNLVTDVARSFGAARIWLTEYGYQTNPPDTVLGVSPGLQARYVGDASYVAYKTPRADMLIHFLYRDEPDIGRFQSGLVTLAGATKPAFAAFQLPLAEVSRQGTRTTLWGEVRSPLGASAYRLEKRVGARWVPFATGLTRGGYFGYAGTLPARTTVRTVSGSLVSPPLVIT